MLKYPFILFFLSFNAISYAQRTSNAEAEIVIGYVYKPSLLEVLKSRLISYNRWQSWIGLSVVPS